MNTEVSKLASTVKGFPKSVQRRLSAAMDRENEALWFSELVKRGERPEVLVELKPCCLARRLVAIAG